MVGIASDSLPVVVATLLASLFSCINVANALWVVCYVVRDVLLLRILAVAAMLIIIPHYVFNTHDQVAVWWNVLFIGINATWIVMILRERQPPSLSKEQQRLYQLTFRDCTERQMLSLLERAEHCDADPGQMLLAQGESTNALLLIAEGTATVKDRDRPIARLNDGDFAGEMSYLSGLPTTASVEAKGSVKYLSWSKESLSQLFEKRVDLESAFRNVIGNNLVTKLSDTSDRATELTRSIT